MITHRPVIGSFLSSGKAITPYAARFPAEENLASLFFERILDHPHLKSPRGILQNAGDVKPVAGRFSFQSPHIFPGAIDDPLLLIKLIAISGGPAASPVRVFTSTNASTGPSQPTISNSPLRPCGLRFRATMAYPAWRRYQYASVSPRTPTFKCRVCGSSGPCSCGRPPPAAPARRFSLQINER